jgi:HSP20 family protein
MGILDKVGSLLPWRSEDREPQRPAHAGVLALRDDFDRWIERLFDEPAFGRGALGLVPSAEVRETDDAMIVTVEVPGLSGDDLGLTLTPDGLVIRGEKHEEREDRRADVYVAERRYGSFVRTVPLPAGLDVDRATARVEHGVLTVTFPRSGTRPGTRRIGIRT